MFSFLHWTKGIFQICYADCTVVPTSPTNIASVHLVMGRPNVRAGVKIAEKKNPYRNHNVTQNLTPITNYH